MVATITPCHFCRTRVAFSAGKLLGSNITVLSNACLPEVKMPSKLNVRPEETSIRVFSFIIQLFLLAIYKKNMTFKKLKYFDIINILRMHYTRQDGQSN